MKIFTVGGAVRDALLGLPVQDRDHVVVDSSPSEMVALGFRHIDTAFGVRRDYESTQTAIAREHTASGLHRPNAEHTKAQHPRLPGNSTQWRRQRQFFPAAPKFPTLSAWRRNYSTLPPR